MKLKQMMLAFVAAMAFGAAATSTMAQPTYPSVRLFISGSLYSTTNSGTNMGVPIKLLGYNNQVLFNLLNASTGATNKIFLVTGVSRIPAGSFFVWNPDTDSLTISNANGFSFPLVGNADGTYDFGYLEVDDDQLVGTFGIDNFDWPGTGVSAGSPTFAGTETDSTGVFFYFNDSNVNELDIYGTATLTWTYGAASGGNQMATLSVTMTGAGNDDCYVNEYDAIPATFSASGTGSGLEPTDDVPFFYEY